MYQFVIILCSFLANCFHCIHGACIGTSLTGVASPGLEVFGLLLDFIVPKQRNSCCICFWVLCSLFMWRYLSKIAVHHMCLV